MSKLDEKAIERDFCAGVLSLQAVADKHGITIKALRYMAGKHGWKRTKGAKAKAGQKIILPPKKCPKKVCKIMMTGHGSAGRLPMKKKSQEIISIWFWILMNSG